MLKLGELHTILKADDTQFKRSLDRARQDFQGFGDRVTAASAVVGAAIAAGLGAGLAAAINADKAKARLAAQLGGNAQYAADMGRIAGAVYARGFGESAQAVGDTLRAVLSSGLLAEDAADADIERITVKAQALADVFDQDVTQAARAAGQMIRTGLAKDADQALDLIVRGFQQSGDHAGDLLDTVSEYSTQFRSMGLNGATALGLLQQGLKAGARDADTVADALKEFSIEAVAGGERVRVGFESLGLNADKMVAKFAAGGPTAAAALDTVLDRLRKIENPARRNAVAIELFGTKAEDLGQALYALDVDTAADRLGNVAGAADELGKTLEESSSQKLEAFKRQVQSALVEKLAEALPTLIAVGEWMQENSDFVGAVVIVLGGLAAIIGVVTLATKAWAIAQIALNIAMMLNPVGLIVLAIIGLIAIIVGLWMRFEGFRNFWKATWDFILAVFQTWWSVFSGFWMAVGGFFVDLFKAWWNLFTGFWSGVRDQANAAVIWIGDKISSFVGFVKSLPGKIASAAKGLFNGFKDAFRNAINWIIGKWNSLSFTLPSVSIPGLGKIGGGTLSTPNIPHLATGGDVLRSGLAVIHEGERVLPAAQVDRLDGGGRHAEARELWIRGELRVRGDDLVLVLRERVAIGGGDVQRVIGTSR